MSVSVSERLHPNSSFIRRWTCLYRLRECVWERCLLRAFLPPSTLFFFFFFPLFTWLFERRPQGKPSAYMRSKIWRKRLRGQRLRGGIRLRGKRRGSRSSLSLSHSLKWWNKKWCAAVYLEVIWAENRRPSCLWSVGPEEEDKEEIQNGLNSRWSYLLFISLIDLLRLMSFTPCWY